MVTIQSSLPPFDTSGGHAYTLGTAKSVVTSHAASLGLLVPFPFGNFPAGNGQETFGRRFRRGPETLAERTRKLPTGNGTSLVGFDRMRMLTGAVLVAAAEQAFSHALLVRFPQDTLAQQILLPASGVLLAVGLVFLIWGVWTERCKP